MILACAIACCLLGGLTWLVIAKPWKMPVLLVDARENGRRVDENGVFGNYYPTRSAERHPGILVIGGSEGGIHDQVDRDARALSREGYSVLALSFFRGPGQPRALGLIPLEVFDRALEWLRYQPEVDAKFLAIVGMSKGAEAALLVASSRPDITAVVAAVPSSVVWPGFDWARFRGLKESSWSREGRPLSMLPYGRMSWASGVRSIYENGLKAVADHPETVIPIERCRAAILLVCGGKDQVWPSCVMAEQIAARARELSGSTVTILSYPDADHGAFASPMEPGGQTRRFGFGRPASGNVAAQTDSWSRTLAFLRDRLQPS